jgi:outer membrane protein assembly factor BamE (lipoprotein component of BamABCDE complex)
VARLVPLLAATLLALVACQDKGLKKRNVDQVEKGMAKKQVESILGMPTTVDAKDFAATHKTTYIYTQGKDIITIVFRDDKVESKETTLTD